MSAELDHIELYMGPTSLQGPDDLEKAICDFLAGAEAQLLIAVQEVDSRAVAQAMLDAKARGVQVRLILEGDYLWEGDKKSRPADPWSLEGPNEENRLIQNALLRAGIDIISDLNPKIFHQKFIVRDASKPTAALLTGSTNFTLTDTGKNVPGGSVSGNNLNHIVVIHDKAVAKQYEAEFTRMRNGTFGELHERVEPKPEDVTVDGIRIKPLFAPYQGPEMEIMKQMLKAEKSIDFAMFTFTTSSGIDDALIRLHGQIPRVRGVVDRTQGGGKGAVNDWLIKAGIELHTNKTGTGVRKIHHKLMVIDDRLTIIGSFNYTGPANTLNDENIIVIGDLEAEAGSAADTAQRKLAMYARKEIDRIIEDLSEPV